MHIPTFEDVVALHDGALKMHGGAPGIRDANALHSAIARPANLAAYGPSVDVPHCAATLAYGIARNHPFVDANKRTAWLSAVLLLALNGLHRPNASVDDVVGHMLTLAQGTLTQEDFAAWLRARIP